MKCQKCFGQSGSVGNNSPKLTTVDPAEENLARVRILVWEECLVLGQFNPVICQNLLEARDFLAEQAFVNNKDLLVTHGANGDCSHLESFSGKDLVRGDGGLDFV